MCICTLIPSRLVSNSYVEQFSRCVQALLRTGEEESLWRI